MEVGGSFLGWIWQEGEERSLFTGCPPFLLRQVQAGVRETMGCMDTDV